MQKEKSVKEMRENTHKRLFKYLRSHKKTNLQTAGTGRLRKWTKVKTVGEFF